MKKFEKIISVILYIMFAVFALTSFYNFSHGGFNQSFFFGFIIIFFVFIVVLSILNTIHVQGRTNISKKNNSNAPKNNYSTMDINQDGRIDNPIAYNQNIKNPNNDFSNNYFDGIISNKFYELEGESYLYSLEVKDLSKNDYFTIKVNEARYNNFAIGQKVRISRGFKRDIK